MQLIEDVVATAKLAILVGGSYWFELVNVTSTKIFVAVMVISSVGSIEWYERRNHENT